MKKNREYASTKVFSERQLGVICAMRMIDLTHL